MGKPGAFLDIDRVTHELRPVEERNRDFDPLYVELDDDARRAQASRCMMCGVAFCMARSMKIPFVLCTSSSTEVVASVVCAV